MTKYSPKNIYNIDETALFYRQLPSKTFFVSNSPHFGSKISKERITICLCCNQNGDKLDPLIIGKFNNPRVFQSNRETLNQFIYKNNSAAWMTKHIFSNYLMNWDEKLEQKDEKIALMLDNFSGHKILETDYPNIEFIWLPPGTTSHLQPLDNGIIKVFKDEYINFLFKNFFDCFENNMNLSEIVKSVSLLDAVWVCQAWHDVSPSTVRNCWTHCHYIREFEGEEVVGEVDEVDEYDDEMIENEENPIEQDLNIIYDQLPITSKDKLSLVQYMEQMCYKNHNSYILDSVESRGF
ncbi:tigger transposable element-derived protein 6-like [Tetranychus urticae]|uniref:tigger transposable element-derived protein 6-like n=1 Tax=Tetranychus urticae TaxID=32264 RepID=UPI000D64A969|nr:tigger transposable element-derived protein 6-like [Tetranychus urticae]